MIRGGGKEGGDKERGESQEPRRDGGRPET